jgi:hypothetical protein
MSTEGSSKPRSEREWRVYRRGILEGIRRAQAQACADAANFRLRAECGGVTFDTPSAAEAVQTSAAKRRRVS